MRPYLLLPLALVSASCVGTTSQRTILQRAKAEVAMRETWSDTAYIRIEEVPRGGCLTWKVSAGAFDASDYPEYKGPYVLPGTERSLCFSKNGCLLSYTHPNISCTKAAPYQPLAPVPDLK
jgi:hypothetical protein